MYTVQVAVKEKVVVILPSGDNKFKNFVLSDIFIKGALDGNNITASVPFGTDVTDLSAVFEIHPKATAGIASGDKSDFSSPVTYEVTAENGDKASYTVNVTVQPQDVGVRGVWLTNVGSNALNSLENINTAVDLCDELNINTIFVVTWNKALTMYPSEVAQSITGNLIDPIYGSRDPLRELIDAAHAKDIKVIAWYEYGFAAFNGSKGPVLNVKPEWESRDKDGGIVVKNGFYWMNAFLPEVQQFMIDMVTEVVEKYPDIDGVQGDDRLPAMPSEGGYDDYTVGLYKAAHDNQEPPQTSKNIGWLRWRADLINEFGRALYDSVKAVNSNAIVAMSPSPGGFGYDEYLQDYASWVNGSYSDIVSPQLYRRDYQGLNVYKNLLTSQLNLIDADKRKTFFPGILLYLGGYIPKQQFLADMIQANRVEGIQGEVYFFYTGFTDPDVQKVLKAMYPAKAIYPDFL